jgi:hypothetical protein
MFLANILFAFIAYFLWCSHVRLAAAAAAAVIGHLAQRDAHTAASGRELVLGLRGATVVTRVKRAALGRNPRGLAES